MAKFRCGVAPLRIETGRYENIREDQRICPICKSDIENETHAILKRYLCEKMRATRVDTAVSICTDFDSLSDIEKMKPENDTNMCQNI